MPPSARASEVTDDSEDSSSSSEESESNSDEVPDLLVDAEERPFINPCIPRSCHLWLHDANSDSFNMVVGLVILTNAVVIGLETDLGAEHFVFFEHFFCIFFVLELILKHIRLSFVEPREDAEDGDSEEGAGYWSCCTGFCRYWTDPSCVFDGVLVVSGILDLYVFSVLFANKKGGLVSMFRMLRMIRVMRILRLFKVFHQLSVILAAFLKAFNSVMWVMLLILILDYVCAIFMTKIFGHHAQAWGPVAADVEEWFGSIGHSMRTLFIVMTLAEWDTIAVVLQTNRTQLEAFFIFLFFIFYVMVAGFTMASLITAILCESLVRAQQEDEEFKAEEQRQEQARFREDVKNWLVAIDRNKDGRVRVDKVRAEFSSAKFLKKLETIGILVEKEQIEMVLQQLQKQQETQDDKNHVDIESLLDIIGELSGDAKAITVFDIRSKVKAVDEMQVRMQNTVIEMQQIVGSLKRRIRG